MIKGLIYIVIAAIVGLIDLITNTEEFESPIYTQYVSEVTSAFLKEMHKEYGFDCGASGGRMPHDVEEISVSLVAYQSATVEQARQLLIKTTERFAQIINAHEKIRPFLREYPFPSSRSRVSISFRNQKKKKFSLYCDYVTHVLQAKNRIYYLGDNPDNPYVGKDIADEPYEEALKIVEANNQNNTQKKISKKLGRTK
jgi:hypothetical protein